MRPLGIALLLVSIGYVMITVVYKKPLRIRETEIQLPRTRMTVLQLFVAAADLTVAAGCLYVLVSHNLPGVNFGEFLGMYLLAVTAVIITHVPGGVGVFELVVLNTIPAAPDSKVTVMAALLVFRVIYYLLPLAVALLLLAGNELVLRRVVTTHLGGVWPLGKDGRRDRAGLGGIRRRRGIAVFRRGAAGLVASGRSREPPPAAGHRRLAFCREPGRGRLARPRPRAATPVGFCLVADDRSDGNRHRHFVAQRPEL